MRPFERVVFDTSTLMGAALRVGSVPHQALMKAYSSTVLCASIETMDELDKVILRPKFDPYLDKETRAGFVASLRQNVQIFAIGAGETAVAGLDCRDPKDNKFLALALAAEADLIISSDHDLLVLNRWNGIAILTPAEFLA